jgi:hypothetical protein
MTNASIDHQPTAVPQLAPADLVTGMAYTNQTATYMAMVETAKRAELQFIEHLRVSYGMPEGWTIRNWAVGFEPPSEVEHGHHHD